MCAHARVRISVYEDEKKIRELERENTKLIIKTQSASTPTPTFTPITGDVSMNSSTASNSPIANNVDNLKEDFDAIANESPYSEYSKTKEDMTAPFEETNFAVLFGSKPMVFASHESPEKQLLQGTKQQNKTVVSSEILHKHAENSPTIATLPATFPNRRRKSISAENLTGKIVVLLVAMSVTMWDGPMPKSSIRMDS